MHGAGTAVQSACERRAKSVWWMQITARRGLGDPSCLVERGGVGFTWASQKPGKSRATHDHKGTRAVAPLQFTQIGAWLQGYRPPSPTRFVPFLFRTFPASHEVQMEAGCPFLPHRKPHGPAQVHSVSLLVELTGAKHFIASTVPNPPSIPLFSLLPYNQGTVHKFHAGVYCSPDLGLRVDVSWR